MGSHRGGRHLWAQEQAPLLTPDLKHVCGASPQPGALGQGTLATQMLAGCRLGGPGTSGACPKSGEPPGPAKGRLLKCEGDQRFVAFLSPPPPTP